MDASARSAWTKRKKFGPRGRRVAVFSIIKEVEREKEVEG